MTPFRPFDINIACSCGQDHPVRGWPSATPGLAVTPDRVGHRLDTDGWRITHVLTGQCLPAMFEEPEAAMACAADVGCATDWDWTAPDRPPGDIESCVMDTLDTWGATQLGRLGDFQVRNEGVPW